MRTIRRDSSVEQVVHRLAEAAHPKTNQPIFPTYRDLAVFAALVGFEADRKKSVGTESKDLVDGRVFVKDDVAVDILCLVALASCQDVEVLRPENEERAVDIFEGYVNGGLQTLGDWLKETPEDPNGDRALLNALYKHRYLTNDDVEGEHSIEDVTF